RRQRPDQPDDAGADPRQGRGGGQPQADQRHAQGGDPCQGTADVDVHRDVAAAVQPVQRGFGGGGLGHRRRGLQVDADVDVPAVQPGQQPLQQPDLGQGVAQVDVDGDVGGASVDLFQGLLQPLQPGQGAAHVDPDADRLDLLLDGIGDAFTDLPADLGGLRERPLADLPPEALNVGDY